MTVWMLVPVLRYWRSRRPEVQLDLTEFTSADAMADSIEANRADIAIGPRPTTTDAHLETIGQVEFVVVAPTGHAFTGLGAIPMKALENQPFVHYDPDNAMAAYVDRLAAQHGVTLNPVLRSRTSRTAAQLAAAGMGVTIVPVSALTPRPTGVVRRLSPIVKYDVVAIVAAQSDSLVKLFVADVHRRGVPTWPGPT
jgi:DNA-binding transcriptional LysR family regulator